MPINLPDIKASKINTLILITGLAFLVGALIFFKFFISKEAPEAMPTPTPTLSLQLTLLKIDPPSGDHQTTSPVSAITFTFSDRIDPKSISYTITPNIELTWELDETKKTIRFRPLEPWRTEQEYKLIISKKLASTSSSTLKEDLVYIYKLVPIAGE